MIMCVNTVSSDLLPPTPATIHLVGIGGIGVSGLARILLHRGYGVTGSDISESPIVDGMRELGIPVSIGHAEENVGQAALVVTTSAAREDNPELAAARRRGIPVIKRADLLGALSQPKVCLAVAGSHGKSTTAGMLAHTLARAGEDPSFAVGATIPQLGANAGPGDGPHFVVEADEYDYSFLKLSPDIAIVNNIEHDHPDLFPDIASIDSAFQQFARRVTPDGTILISADDPGCDRLAKSVLASPGHPEVVAVGRSEHADWRLDDRSLPAVLYCPDGSKFRLCLAVPGRHNRMNAAMVFVACHLLKVEPARVLEGISTFTGVGRRFELRGEVNGIRIFDDYAHHPTELEATITAAREAYPGSRIWAVFQPHTYSRTRQLLAAFASALDTADRTTLVEIYPARETDDLGVSSRSIAERMRTDADVLPTPEAAADHIADSVREGDVVLMLGAGDIWKAAPELLNRLQAGTGNHG